MDWCWSWNSNNLATWSEELTHWKRPWCWEKVKAEGEKDKRGWEGWMASLTQWTWVWVDSGSWWWTGRPGILWFMGSQVVGHDWATELNWNEAWKHYNLLLGVLPYILYLQHGISPSYFHFLTNEAPAWTGHRATVLKEHWGWAMWHPLRGGTGGAGNTK